MCESSFELALHFRKVEQFVVFRGTCTFSKFTILTLELREWNSNYIFYLVTFFINLLIKAARVRKIFY